MPRMIRKSDLPSKPCQACARPFAWRKKWARDWDSVKFCSDACRRLARSPGTNAPSAPDAGRKSRWP